MAQLMIQNVSFTYDGSYEPVFENLSVSLDTRWRLGLVGRNGRGKTTLLGILSGRLNPKGTVTMPVKGAYFPCPVQDATLLCLFVMQQIAPDAEEWQIRRECNLLGLCEDALYRPFETLSRGEQTKAQLAALFARQDVYPLIDEPTNHLDLHGRELVARYLRGKDGFLLVSHDRSFLNLCIDHVLSINRADVQVQNGNFDTWEQELERQNRFELNENERLKKDIRRLAESARKTADWSNKCEKGKFGLSADGATVADRGYVGARSADMMKRSLSTLKRRERAVEEKSKLLHNLERVGELKLMPLSHPKERLMEVRGGRVAYGERTVCDPVEFSLRRGERLALCGSNGAGKSSILKALCGLGGALEGEILVASGLVISYVPQDTSELQGNMRQFIEGQELDEALFKAILRNMDFGRELFERSLPEMSQGQKKKALLAKSLCQSAHVYVWDEPMNYIDVLSRMQIERLIEEFQPTMLLVEHDRAFLERICTGVLELG